MSRQFAVEVVRQLVHAGHIAYWAGGCVRDLLRGEDPADYDVATNATPDQVRDLFGRRRTLSVGESFGVIIVLGPKGTGIQVEVATFRSEGEYKDGRRPESVAYCSPEEDAQRRDFTINGMFYDPLAEVVHDFVGGQEDMRRKVVRAIGDPHHRMTEDKLRMLRAVRFAAKFEFELDAVTAVSIREMASQVIVVSAERIAQELRKTLENVHRSRAIRLFEELGLLDVILPEAVHETVNANQERWQHILETLEALGPASFETAFALLLCDLDATVSRRAQKDASHHDVVGICRRLKLSNDETDRIQWLVAHGPQVHKAPSLSLAELKRLAAHEEFSALIHLERTFSQVTGKDPAPFERIDEFLKQTSPNQIDPPELLTGQDLISQGLKPGKMFKELLEIVRVAQLNEEISTKDEALTLVKDRLDR
ncbi:MAG: CCA tRNA nucleotidyltransferase [Planctomycetaceae bacterium]|nr:CCA tRNA nucleotidyltransferase [Planctomycetaceae bacterium]